MLRSKLLVSAVLYLAFMAGFQTMIKKLRAPVLEKDGRFLWIPTDIVLHP